ncbi:hypothetical protein D8674_018834 [Pyrus ussuriensis x Pyrus communis]|uniref:Uncharacterized protein n=1 Tax=Pyrus ussuriensis x Pyrus communis TaxID=2448454 RepID=A0A5N5GBI4_9ROSA|nr:hypothetical protein D8674_018834 [Pyrus ussuriensis x Pyrus communis]
MGFCVPWDPLTWVFTLPVLPFISTRHHSSVSPPSRNPLFLLLHIFLCHLPYHLCAHCTENRSIHLHLTSHFGEPCHHPNTTLPPSLSHNLSKHISNDGDGTGDLRRGNHQRHLPLLTADSPLPFAFWKLKLTRRNDKLHRCLTPRQDFLLNPFGCSFNSGDKFPRFSARAMIFRLILRYHRPPNGPEEGKIRILTFVDHTDVACGTVVDGAWSTGASTGRMIA